MITAVVEKPAHMPAHDGGKMAEAAKAADVNTAMVCAAASPNRSACSGITRVCCDAILGMHLCTSTVSRARAMRC